MGPGLGRLHHILLDADPQACAVVVLVALVDTNADPSLVDYVIPANDDAIKSVQLITDYVVAAINAGKAKVKTADKDEEQNEGDN